MDPSGPIFETNSNGDVLNNNIIMADINKIGFKILNGTLLINEIMYLLYFAMKPTS